MNQRLWSAISFFIVAALLVAACGQATPAAPTPAPTSAPPTEAPHATEAPAATTAPAATEGPTAEPGALRDPKEAALEAAGGQQLGGTLSILGVWGGSELESFLAVVKPFEEATGVKVEFEGTRDFNAVLTTRVEGGNPPDLAAPPSAGQIAEWAKAGKLVDLTNVVDLAQMKQDYAQSWLDLGTSEGKLVAVFTWSALKGPIWYNPKTYDGPNPPRNWDELQAWAEQKAASGQTPWCIGLESGAASGWAGTDWLEDIVLRQSGPAVYDQWYQGQLAWSSPEIKSAFELFGAIAADPTMVNGGPISVLTLNFGNGGDQLFTDPPGCYLHHQATFITDFFVNNTPGLKPVEDFNFFGFPDINPKYSGTLEVVGDSFSVYKDTPQARAFIKYLTSPEAQAIWVARGGKLAANRRVPLEAYPDAIARNAGEIMASAQAVRFDASDLMPSAMNEAFWKAVLDYVQSPGDLDNILAGLDEVRAEAYSK
jgi:alpha-glucoside transport system substrate-binding protein